MAKLGRWMKCIGLVFTMSLPALVGCQTHINGMTLPSGYYLKDSPDYIPRAPDYPLGNELNSQQKAFNNAYGGNGKVGPGGFQQP